MSNNRFTLAERAFTSCCLTYGTAEVITAVRPEQVADPLCRKVIETAATLLSEGVAVDPITVSMALSYQGADWPPKVLDVYQEQGAVHKNWRFYVAEILEGDYRRRAVIAGTRITEAAKNSENLDVVASMLAAAAQVTP